MYVAVGRGCPTDGIVRDQHEVGRRAGAARGRVERIDRRTVSVERTRDARSSGVSRNGWTIPARTRSRTTHSLTGRVGKLERSSRCLCRCRRRGRGEVATDGARPIDFRAARIDLTKRRGSDRATHLACAAGRPLVFAGVDRAGRQGEPPLPNAARCTRRDRHARTGRGGPARNERATSLSEASASG